MDTQYQTPGKALDLEGREVFYLKDHVFVETRFECLKPGYIFKLFDRHKLHVNSNGVATFKATSMPFEQFGVLCITCEEHHEDKVETPVTSS